MSELDFAHDGGEINEREHLSNAHSSGLEGAGESVIIGRY
jgi:hypothetical protein